MGRFLLAVKISSLYDSHDVCTVTQLWSVLWVFGLRICSLGLRLGLARRLCRRHWTSHCEVQGPDLQNFSRRPWENLRKMTELTEISGKSYDNN